MYAFKVNGQWLMLYPGSGTQLELQHPIVATSFEEPFSLPVEVPIDGNEVVLGHVHQLALAVRRLTIPEVELWRDGLFKHKGIFTVESSSEESITLTFSVDGFLTGLRDKRLRDVDFGPDINLVGDTSVLATMAEVNNTAWPYQRFCFPMMRNKDAYSNNPDWWHAGEAYNQSTSYGITTPPTYITYTKDENVRRERVFECIGAAPAGENPDNTPFDWRMLGQGLINPWNPNTASWRVNTTKNENAISPQFYLKDVLIRAMADQGYTALGDFIDDVRSHRVLVYNNQLLDEGERENHVLASVTTDLNYPAGTSSALRLLQPQDDFNPPNEDPDAVYDPSTGLLTCNTAGAYTIKAHIRSTLTDARRVGVLVVRVSDGAFVLSGVSGEDGDLRTFWDFTFNGVLNVAAGEEGDYKIRVYPTWSGTPLNGTGNTIEVGSYLEFYKGTGALVNTWKNNIIPAEHVPDITVSKLLNEVRQLFHLRIVPDVVNKTIRFDYQLDILSTPIGRDITEEVRGPISLDHTQRVFGVRLKNARGRVDQLPDLSGHTQSAQATGAFMGVITEGILDPPTADNQKIRVANTNQMYVSRLYATNLLAWFPLGAYQPDTEIGDMDGALEIAPEFGAPDMDLMPAPDSSVCLMPVIDEPSSSQMFSQGKNAPSLLLMWYHGMQLNGEGNAYPLASPYAFNQQGTGISNFGLSYQPAPASLAGFWKPWLDRFVKAEVWQCDLDVSRLLNRNGVEHGRFLCKHQEVILHTVPLEYDDSDGLPLIAQAARLLKLPRETGPLARDGGDVSLRNT